ncbi:hypothetical protein QY895_00935 [Latilactobacillus sakei]
MNKKRLGIVALLLMVAMVIAGCGQTKQTTKGIQVVSSLDFYGEVRKSGLRQARASNVNY